MHKAAGYDYFSAAFQFRGPGQEYLLAEIKRSLVD
jgi:hypothetical protein